ncbi:MAG: Verru_Chthon cassette protein B [Verrucomicrobiae bacterium]
MVPLIGDSTATLDVGATVPAPQKRSGRGGFSLVEVTLAIGIVAFAFLTILGLIPTGLRTFRGAIDTSVSGQIFQRIVNEAQQTDFDTLVATTQTTRYFDDQGNDVASAGNWIYQVNTRILPSTDLPDGTAGANANLATITVQIAKNPGNAALDLTDDNLWTTNSGISFLTHSSLVARNK